MPRPEITIKRIHSRYLMLFFLVFLLCCFGGGLCQNLTRFLSFVFFSSERFSGCLTFGCFSREDFTGFVTQTGKFRFHNFVELLGQRDADENRHVNAGFNGGAGIDAQFCNEGTDGDDDQLGCRLHFFGFKYFQSFRSGEYAEKKGVEDRKQDQCSWTDGYLNLTDGIGDDDKEKRQQKDFIFVAQAIPGRRIQVGFFFYDRLLL